MSTHDSTPGEPRQEQPQQPRADEPSPRSLRIMASVRWVVLALVTALAAYAVWSSVGGADLDAGAAHDHAGYYCPMHPQITSPEPGECPICHMKLEPIPKGRKAQTASAQPTYHCPMHPQITSHAPGTCPICSMRLEPVPEKPQPETTATPAQPAAGPADVAPVTLSPDKQQAVGLLTTPVESAALGDRLRVPGVIGAPQTGLAEVRVRAPGFVERVAVRQNGVRVTRGQALAYVYSPEIYRAQEEFIAARRWSGSGTGERPSGPAAEVAAAARRGLELLGLGDEDIDEIARTGRPIRAIAVRAPAGGVVTRFNAVLGSRAEPEMVLYEIADLSSVWVIASVHERELGALRVGQKARFVSSGGEAQPLAGRIDLIEPLLEESTRTTRVRLVVPNRDGRLRPGQFGEVEFELAASPGLLVPRDAVIRTGESAYVYVATGDDRFEPRRVTTGIAREGRVQITSGLSAGERVVTRGSFMLDSESRLQASLAATSAPRGGAEGASDTLGPACDTAFDRERFAEKHTQCRACELQHAGMGNMVADCKNAIPKPWR